MKKRQQPHRQQRLDEHFKHTPRFSSSDSVSNSIDESLSNPKRARTSSPARDSLNQVSSSAGAAAVAVATTTVGSTLTLLTRSLEDALTCAICIGVIGDFMALQCGHGFCKLCIEPWFQRGQTTCPQCRTFTLGQLTPIHSANAICAALIKSMRVTPSSDANAEHQANDQDADSVASKRNTADANRADLQRQEASVAATYSSDAAAAASTANVPAVIVAMPAAGADAAAHGENVEPIIYAFSRLGSRRCQLCGHVIGVYDLSVSESRARTHTHAHTRKQ